MIHQARHLGSKLRCTAGSLQFFLVLIYLFSFLFFSRIFFSPSYILSDDGALPRHTGGNLLHLQRSARTSTWILLGLHSSDFLVRLPSRTSFIHSQGIWPDSTAWLRRTGSGETQKSARKKTNKQTKMTEKIGDPLAEHSNPMPTRERKDVRS